MSNKEIAKLLRSAASALEHGRWSTARKKLIPVVAWFVQTFGIGIAGNIDPRGVLAPVVANAKPVSKVVS